MIDFFWIYIGYSFVFIVFGGVFIYFTNVKHRNHFSDHKHSLWHQIKKLKETHPKDGLITQTLLLAIQVFSFSAIVYFFWNRL